jgi:hypothetical protein
MGEFEVNIENKIFNQVKDNDLGLLFYNKSQDQRGFVQIAKVMEYFSSSLFNQTLVDLHQIWNFTLINCRHNGVIFESFDKEGMKWTGKRFNEMNNIRKIRSSFDDFDKVEI